MNDENAIDLLKRKSLPEDLRYLVEKYPRETWDGTAQAIGMTARFWLDRHDMFRELGGALAERAGDLRENRLDAADFAKWFVPRLNFFLGELNGHHMVEDQHYFPVFAAAEPRMKRGFDILDRDHETIHALLEGNARAAREFLSTLETGGDVLKRSVDVYAADIDRLLSGLQRHLDDEEDIVIPLLIDRGEGGF